jgi:hypothetical protein
LKDAPHGEVGVEAVAGRVAVGKDPGRRARSVEREVADRKDPVIRWMPASAG